ncbi:glycosyltransferase family 2 protein [Sphingomonas hankookensis]|uniref:glycosyltransferase family 2 protein n=1 Tax=Sphingomonas hankookensis TaxID=563996 RepID=UPI001F5778D3|nr:glycosyltransferase family 2 protein [Sphingomonas hankookensis]
MTQAPLFSVIIPTYNRADKILPTLESVREQTLGDFECLVVDDGSRDGDALAAVVAGLGDDRFRYIRTPNRGASAARNTGFDEARGRYVALLDSDDRFLPAKLARNAALLEQHGADAMIFSQIAMDRGIGSYWMKPPRGPAPGERIDEYFFCARGWVPTSTMALSTDVARKVRFDEALPSSQDTDFAIRCASAGIRFVYIPEALAIGDDIFDPQRVSKSPKYEPLLRWIDDMRHNHVSDRAYWAYRGWHYARSLSKVRRLDATREYLQSVLHGAYPPRLALVVGAQVMLPTTAYQRTADLVAYVFGKKGRGGIDAAS